MNQERTGEIETLKKQWACLLPTVPLPPDAQFDLWRRLHTFETVSHGIRHAAKKNIKTGFAMTSEWAIRFASSCMNNYCRSREAKTNSLLEALEGSLQHSS